MSEPTLTDEQRETLWDAIADVRDASPRTTDDAETWDIVNAIEPAVAAMLADERTAREAAEAKVRDLTAGIGALAEEWRYKGEFGWGPWQEGYGPDLEGEALDMAATRLRALVDDPAAALAEVRAETLRNQRDFFKAIDMPAAADHCEQSAIGWDSSADDARRRAEAEGATR